MQLSAYTHKHDMYILHYADLGIFSEQFDKSPGAHSVPAHCVAL